MGFMTISLGACCDRSNPLWAGPSGVRYPTFCGWPDRRGRSTLGWGCSMTAPVTASERDLRILAGIVSDDRTDLPAEGLPPSLLSDLMDQIRCDFVSFEGLDSGRHALWFWQEIPIPADDAADEAWCDGWDQRYWSQYWDCKPSSYPDRSGDLRSVVKIADFYSAKQWHSTGMYSDIYRPPGI